MIHFGIIMTGGGGTRFWPLSREAIPKQFINLTGKNTMVNEAIARIEIVIDKKNIFIVTSEIQSTKMVEYTSSKIAVSKIIAPPINS